MAVQPVDVLRPLAGPYLLPAELGARWAGVGSCAVHLVAHLPEHDGKGVGVPMLGSKGRPRADGAPVAAASVDADLPRIVDISVEECDESGCFLSRCVRRHRPHALGVCRLQEVHVVAGARRPGPVAAIRVAGFAGLPVVRVAPRPARHPHDRGAELHRATDELGISETLRAEPGRHVRSQQPVVEGPSRPVRVHDDVSVERGAGVRCRIDGRGGAHVAGPAGAGRQHDQPRNGQHTGPTAAAPALVHPPGQWAPRWRTTAGRVRNTIFTSWNNDQLST